jgi:BirA family biotin operon repressor/biotin-[acetyl-CoA-carboxylase] ligase
VVGVGINVGQAEEDFPSELRGRATSLRIASGERTFDRTLLMASYLREFGRLSESLARGRWGEIVAGWESRAPEAQGRRVRVTSNPAAGARPFEGTTCGLDAIGALRIERATGEVVSLRLGESVEVLEG